MTQFKSSASDTWLLGKAQAEDQTASVNAGRQGSSASEPNKRFAGLRALGRFVELSRRQAGWSIDVLANQAGIDVWYVRQIEAGRGDELSCESIDRIAAALNLPAAKLRDLASLDEPPRTLSLVAAEAIASLSDDIDPLNSREQQALSRFIELINADDLALHD